MSNEVTEKEKIIISKSKSEATSKKEDIKPAATGEKKKEPVVHDAKEQSIKPDPAKMHPAKEAPVKGTSKANKFIGGLKNIFRKTPSSQ